MKKILIVLSFLIGLGSSTAQSFVRLSAGSNNAVHKFQGRPDTLKILAVMVEFQADTDPNTYGTGKFGTIYTQTYGDTILDPLPHDAQYFSNHLEFAANYFRKVSNGKMNIEYTVLPQVITVSKTMRNYSPTPTNTSDLSSEAEFAKEVWQSASGLTDFSKYDLFTIFHAGVGRELTPPGSIGLERDLFSVYFGLSSLQNYLGGSFAGFPVNDGKYLIKNTLILPSTESRELDGFTGKVLLELTTNGLIVSSIMSHLGLPDLFNTEKGTSAIGRMGLMDGESIFGYGGIFPPEPSAWEKIYLGWAQPVEVPLANKNYAVAAAQSAGLNDTTILKIPISSSEYYLIENRERDVKSDGSNLTYKLGNQTFTFHSAKDDTGYQWYDVSRLRGVITDADEFDWAVPGNGIVIWHIDENIINAKIAEDKINSDIDHKGVGVVEADGIFDIGRQFTNILGETVTGQATQEDMWYASNQSKFYENKFNDYTKPSAKSNSGAFSLLNLSDFSAAGTKMSFKLSFGSPEVDLVSNTKLNLTAGNTFVNSASLSTGEFIFVVNGSRLTIYTFDGNPVRTFENFSAMPVAVSEWNGSMIVAGAEGKTVNVFCWGNSVETVRSFSIGSNITAVPVIGNSGSELKMFFGAEDGTVHNLSLNSSYEIVHGSAGDLKLADVAIRQICTDGNYIWALTSDSFVDEDGLNVQVPGAIKAVISKNSFGNFYIVVLSSGNQFTVISENGNIVSQFKTPGGSNLTSFSMADLFGSGENFIMLNNARSLEVYNLIGKLADNFPSDNPQGTEFTGAPIAADLNNDGTPEIISAAADGNVYAFDAKEGKILPGFPISAGKSALWPLSFSGSSNLNLVMLNSTGNLYVWNLSKSAGKINWSGESGNPANTSFAGMASPGSAIADYFPESRAYNWPNPVYGNETNIRYFVSEPSDIKIKIFDLAGDLVAELNDQAQGGYDNETKWNVSDIQSGVYFAHIEASSSNGKSASKIIKIAVIK